jgi:hypothetical protein
MGFFRLGVVSSAAGPCLAALNEPRSGVPIRATVRHLPKITSGSIDDAGHRGRAGCYRCSEPGKSLFTSENSLFGRHKFAVPESMNSSLKVSKMGLIASTQQSAERTNQKNSLLIRC